MSTSTVTRGGGQLTPPVGVRNGKKAEAQQAQKKLFQRKVSPAEGRSVAPKPNRNIHRPPGTDAEPNQKNNAMVTCSKNSSGLFFFFLATMKQSARQEILIKTSCTQIPCIYNFICSKYTAHFHQKREIFCTTITARSTWIESSRYRTKIS